MTSPTSGLSAMQALAGTSAATPDKQSVAGKSKDFGDKDTFLKLLVAQLKYQDPSNPADSTQFLAQTAQFTQVEKLGDIADMLKSQRLVGAAGLVGRSVTYMDENGAKLSGTISAVKLNGDSEPTMRIGNADVMMSKLMEVQPNGAAADTSETGSDLPTAKVIGEGGAPVAISNPASAQAAVAAAIAGRAAALPSVPSVPSAPTTGTRPATGPATA